MDVTSSMDAERAAQPVPASAELPVETLPLANGRGTKSPPALSNGSATNRTTDGQIVLIVLGVIAFLYFARSVVLPIVLAGVAGMALKPLIRWSSRWHIPPALSAAMVLCLLAWVVGIGFVQVGRPAVAWMREAPEHMAELRQRVQTILSRAHLSHFATALKRMNTAEDEPSNLPKVEVKDSRVPSTFINWTGSLLAGIGETVVLLYLLLASGDLLLLKLVHVMPTFRDKKRAVEISHEVQHSISNYLFSVTLINLGVGLIVGGGLYWLGVPNAAMWGMLIALLNYIPYFGPILGIILLGTVGLLTFDTLWQGLLPPTGHLLLHLLEANFVTPVLLGRRFTLNPVIIFVSLIFWTWLWGVAGALLSVPILVSFKVVCDRVPALSRFSEFLTS